MFTAQESIDLNASVDAVFAYMDDPHNHMAVTPRLTDVRDIERLDNGGKRLAYTYRIAGLGFDGELVQTVHEPPTRMVFEMHGRLSGRITLAFDADGDGTRLTYGAEYDLPENALTTIGSPVVRRANERQLRTTLENVAARFASGDTE